MDDHRFTRRLVTGDLDDQARAWMASARLGFVQDRIDEQTLLRGWQRAVEDGQVWRAAERDAAVPGLDEGLPAATFTTLRRTINVGGDSPVLAEYVMDVTVRPTDRRRGLLRRMMTQALTEARDDGIVLAALTASEGGIYGRFGFGVSQERQKVELASRRFHLRTPEEITVEQADPSRIVDTLLALADGFHARHRGSHQRMAHHRDIWGGLWDYRADRVPRDVRCAVTIEDGHVTGAVVFSVRDHAVRVVAMIADGPRELALWQYLAVIDMTDRVVADDCQVAAVLRAAATDPRAVEVTATEDWTWLRILDVAAALEARGWEADGEVVLRVDDPMDLAGGTWRVAVRTGRASVEPTHANPDVVLGIEALAATYLGGTSFASLVDAGRVHGDDESVSRLGRMLATAEPPRNLVGF